MSRVPIPASEVSRLKTLLGYEILDTPPEEGFDDLVRLASMVCGTPIALISLVDSKRQWFKARVGLDATETPREMAFCAHAICTVDMLVVPDTTRDERFSANPLVTDAPNIRFYAGMPLIAPDGEALGTICAIDRVPRQITAEQRSALECISRQVVSQLELRRARAKMAAVLNEKIVLLNEVNHRVKNNLQILQSVIDMQSRRTADAAAVDALREVKSRVRSMALIHDTLYISNNVAHVKVAGFLKRLTRDLHAAYAGAEAQIEFAVSAEGIALPMKAAIPCGLIVNELVTNAFKYAFVGRTHGRINVAMTVLDGTVNLTVSDDGAGLAHAESNRTEASLGTTLVELLAAQLNGTFARPSEGKPGYSVSFPLPSAESDIQSY